MRDMASTSDTRLKRLKRWKADLLRWKGDFHLEQRSIEALERAEKYFGLNKSNSIRSYLVFILADVVFGTTGRPRGSKKWSDSKLEQLARDHDEVKRDLPRLGAKKAMGEIKTRHPQRYRDTSAEMMRQMLPAAKEVWDYRRFLEFLEEGGNPVE
jgi:hypothetical protein